MRTCLRYGSDTADVLPLRQRMRAFDPVSVPEESDLFDRWPSGTRTVLAPSVPWIGGVAVLIAIFSFVHSVGQELIPPWIEWLIAVGSAVSVVVLVSWFVPTGRVVLRSAHQVSAGDWVLIQSTAVTFEISASILSAPGDWRGSPDWYLGVQSGHLYQFGEEDRVPVVEVRDLWKRYRLPFVEPEDDQVSQWMGRLSAALETNRFRVARSQTWFADPAIVRTDLKDAGLLDDEWSDLVRMSRNFGLLDRRYDNRTKMDFSPAGQAWFGYLDYVEHESSEDASTALAATIAADVVARLNEVSASTCPVDLSEWVGALLAQFKTVVEERGGVDALWDSARRPQNERAVQAVAFESIRQSCSAAGVRASREVDAGSGPADFVFSRGHDEIVVVEMKMISGSWRHGIRKQLPRYMRAEGTTQGFILCLASNDSEFAKEREIILECTRFSQENDLDIRGVVIDARVKPSASRC